MSVCRCSYQLLVVLLMLFGFHGCYQTTVCAPNVHEDSYHFTIEWKHGDKYFASGGILYLQMYSGRGHAWSTMNHCTYHSQSNATTIECFVPRKKFKHTALIRLLHEQHNEHDGRKTPSVTVYPGRIDRFKCVPWWRRRDFELDITTRNGSENTAKVTYHPINNEYQGHVEVFVDGVNIGSTACSCRRSTCLKDNTTNNKNTSLRTSTSNYTSIPYTTFIQHQIAPSTTLSKTTTDLLSILPRESNASATKPTKKTTAPSTISWEMASAPTTKSSETITASAITPSETASVPSINPSETTTAPSTTPFINATAFTLPAHNNGGCSLFISNLNPCKYYTVCLRIKQSSNSINYNKRRSHISCKQFQLPLCQSYQFESLRDRNPDRLHPVVEIFLAILVICATLILAMGLLYAHHVIRQKNNSSSNQIYGVLV